MITLKGMIYGSKFELRCESNVVCMAFQVNLTDVTDVQSKEGCPKDCKYIIRKPGDNPVFVCDVMT